jgi:hypothetical protein
MPKRNGQKKFRGEIPLSTYSYKCLVEGCRELPSDEIFNGDYGRVLYALHGVRHKTNERPSTDRPLYLCAKHVTDSRLGHRLSSPRMQQMIFDF